MSSRKSFWLISFSVCLILVFCLSGNAAAGPGPNSDSVAKSYKKTGPSPEAFLLVGWIPLGYEIGGKQRGILEAYTWVNGKLYIGIIQFEHPEDLMKGISENDLLAKFDIDGILTESWLFPSEIAQDYKVFDSDTVVVLEEKDISNFDRILDISDDDLSIDVTDGLKPLGFKHLFRCNVRLTFLVPQVVQ